MGSVGLNSDLWACCEGLAAESSPQPSLVSKGFLLWLQCFWSVKEFAMLTQSVQLAYRANVTGMFFLEIVFDNTARIETQIYIRRSWTTCIPCDQEDENLEDQDSVRADMRNFSGLSLMLPPQLTSKAKTENPHPWHLLSSTDSLKYRFIEREFKNNNNKRTAMISPTGFPWRRWLCGFWVLQFFLKIGTRAFAVVYFFGGICVLQWYTWESKDNSLELVLSSYCLHPRDRLGRRAFTGWALSPALDFHSL